MLFIDYTKAVLLDYERKKNDNKLSSRLHHPSPAELRDECEAVLNDRYNPKEALLLKTFFGAFNEKGEILQLIRNHPIDRFKPLVRFLKGGIQEPKKKNIDLIAWLIDFQPRPFEGKDIVPPTHPPVSPDLPPTGTPRPRPRFRRAITIALAAITTTVTSVAVYKSSQHLGDCMYWTGYRYEQIPCDQKKGTVPVIAFDADRLEQFKKITRPDTLTRAAIGRVWYLKLEGEIEFFTADGAHPLRPDKDLHRMTKHIYEEHILPLHSDSAGGASR